MPSLQQSDKSEKSEKLTFRCSPALKRAVRMAAAQADKSLEDTLADLLQRGLARFGAELTEKRKTA